MTIHKLTVTCPQVTTPAPSIAPVIAVTAYRIMDRDPATEIVGLTVQIGQGNGIQSDYNVYVDGIKVGIGSRIPNSTDTSTSVLLPKDGKSHSICADSICTSYTTSLSCGSLTMARYMSYPYNSTDTFANAGIDSSGRALVAVNGGVITPMSVGQTATLGQNGGSKWYQVTLMSIVGTTFTIKIC